MVGLLLHADVLKCLSLDEQARRGNYLFFYACLVTCTHALSQVFTVLFTLAVIGQTEPRPFSINTLTVTLVTNLPLTRTTSISIFPLDGATIDSEVQPGYDSRTNRMLPLGGQRMQSYAAVPCEEGAFQCEQTGKAMWRPETRMLVLYIAEDMVPGITYIFSWRVRNPGRGQAAPRVMVEVGVGTAKFAATPVRPPLACAHATVLARVNVVGIFALYWMCLHTYPC